MKKIINRVLKSVLAMLLVVAVAPSFTATVYAEDSAAKSAVEMPANSFTGTADNGVSVAATVKAGVFPAGTTMKVTSVSDSVAKDAAAKVIEDSQIIVDAQAVDITFYNASGVEIEPADSASVHVELSTGRTVDGSSHEVLHLNDNGTTEKVAEATAKGGTFEGKSFSIYAIVGTATATRTYNFYLSQASTDVYYSQILKNGESITMPAVPAAADNSQFLGWSTTASADNLYTFKAVEGLTADETVKLYPVYKSSYYVIYHNADGTILAQDAVQNGAYTVSSALISSVTVTGDQACVGFASSKTAAAAETSLTINNADINLYPVMKASNWITFNMNDTNDSSEAAYTAPEYVLPGNVTVKPADPTRKGYTFAGWYTDAACKNAFVFGSAMSSDVTLYAKWNAETVTYTVIYWQQELVNGKYVEGNYHYPYYEKETLSGIAGNVIDVTDTATDAYKTQNKNYDYFHFGHADSNVVLSGDGSTILNVYYDLNSYTFNFIYYLGSTLTMDGKTYSALNSATNYTTADLSLYSFTARYGEYVKDKWPLDSNFSNKTYSNYSLLGWMPIDLHTYFKVPRPYITSDLIMASQKANGSVIPMVGYWTPKTESINLKYYVENFDSTDASLTSNYSKFTDYTDVFSAGTSKFYIPVYRGLTASTAVGDEGNPGQIVTKTVDSYYLLTWYNNSMKWYDKDKNVVTSGYNNGSAVQTLPTGVNTVAFPGTYDEFVSARYNLIIGFWPDETNETGLKTAERMRFLMTQQAAGTVVYIVQERITSVSMYYVRNTYNVVFRETASSATTKTALYQQSLNGYYYVPTKAGATFEGWYTSSDFNEKSKVTEDELNAMTMSYTNMILFAKWSDSMPTVTFNYNDGKTANVSVDVMNGSTVADPADPTREGYTFAGWMLNGENFNFDTEIHDDITLTAKWLSNSSLNVKYDADGGVFTETDSNSYADDSKAVVLGEASKSGYYFYGWNLNGNLLTSGETFTVSSQYAVNGTVTLTAVYGPAPVNTSLILMANDGTAASSTTALLNNEKTALPTADDNVFTRSGYVLTGWNTAADGTGTAYALGDSVLVDNSTANVLYAQWVAVRPDTPTVPERPEAPETPEVVERPVSPSTPNTGDQTNAGLFGGALSVSVVLAIAAYVLKKKYYD